MPDSETLVIADRPPVPTPANPLPDGANPLPAGAWPLADGYDRDCDAQPGMDYVWNAQPNRPHPDSVHVDVILATLQFPERTDEMVAAEIWRREFHRHRFYGLLNPPRLFARHTLDETVLVGPVFTDGLAPRNVWLAPRRVVDSLDDRIRREWDGRLYTDAFVGPGDGCGFVSTRVDADDDRPRGDLRFFARDCRQFMQVAHINGPADFGELDYFERTW